MKSANYWINKLNLEKHVEGGYFIESYKSNLILDKECLPNNISANRHCSTAIYYLLKEKDFSRFHRIKSDEMWHFYTGNTSIKIHVLDKKKSLTTFILGSDFEKGEQFQIVIPANKWFCAELSDKNEDSYVLTGCTVSPGFDYTDFEIAEKKSLLKEFFEYEKLISRFYK